MSLSSSAYPTCFHWQPGGVEYCSWTRLMYSCKSERCKTWKETDLFLVSSHSIPVPRKLRSPFTKRSILVLLRLLEHHKGFLFLTTNHVETIDPAFKSRIHLSIAYPPLSANARRELWNSFIERANRGQPPGWLTTDFLDQLVEEKINGREIRNIVRIGYSLARSAKRDLQPTDLLQGLDD